MSELTGTVLAVLTSIVAVPLAIITFYLRSLREHRESWHSEWARRLESVEASALDLRKVITEFERYYTSKEEWLRECMYARRVLEELNEKAVRMETMLGFRAFRPTAKSPNQSIPYSAIPTNDEEKEHSARKGGDS